MRKTKLATLILVDELPDKSRANSILIDGNVELGAATLEEDDE